jgi:hypothetical protein
MGKKWRMKRKRRGIRRKRRIIRRSGRRGGRRIWR